MPNERCVKKSLSVIQKFIGAYGVQYLFVICSFSLPGTENLERDFSWVEPLKARGPNLLGIAHFPSARTAVFAGYGPFI